MNPTLRHSLPWLVVAVVGLWGRFCYGPSMKAKGKDAGAEEVRATVIDSLAQREDSLRKWFAVQMAGWQAESLRWANMPRRVVVKVDTQWVNVPGAERVVVRVDTVTREPTIAEIIEQANRTINACQLALGTCDARVRNLLMANDSLTVSLRYWRSEARPSLWRQIQQLPGRAVVPATIAGLAWAACKVGDEE